MHCSIRHISRNRPHVSPLCPSTPHRQTQTPSQMPSRNTWYWISRKLTSPSRSIRIHPCIIQRENSKRVYLKRMSYTLLRPRENGPRSGQRITEWLSLACSQAGRKAQALDRETMTRANRIGERSLILTTPTLWRIIAIKTSLTACQLLRDRSSLNLYQIIDSTMMLG
jgi:hypothetical protein